jgi:prevent-host-death family protein
MVSPARVGARELKTRLGTYLRRVRGGERIVVTERGAPVAELRGVGGDGVDARLARLHAAGLVSPPTRRTLARLRPLHRRGPSLSQAIDEDREDRL